MWQVYIRSQLKVYRENILKVVTNSLFFHFISISGINELTRHRHINVFSGRCSIMFYKCTSHTYCSLNMRSGFRKCVIKWTLSKRAHYTNSIINIMNNMNTTLFANDLYLYEMTKFWYSIVYDIEYTFKKSKRNKRQK